MSGKFFLMFILFFAVTQLQYKFTKLSFTHRENETKIREMVAVSAKDNRKPLFLDMSDPAPKSFARSIFPWHPGWLARAGKAGRAGWIRNISLKYEKQLNYNQMN